MTDCGMPKSGNKMKFGNFILLGIVATGQAEAEGMKLLAQS